MEASTFKAWKLYSAILAVTIGAYSCEVIFEEDISDKQVVLIAPADSLTTAINSVSFSWHEVKDALKYRLQIAQPSFANLQTISLDTVVSATAFTHTLLTGDYEWRVRAENGSSQTLYTSRYITIDSSSDLSSQTPLLLNPSTGLMTNTTSITFTWNSMFGADQYSFLIKTPNWNGITYGSEVLTTATTTTVSSIPEGQYDWGVRGENSFSNSAYATSSIWVDTTDPASPTSSFPSQGATLGDSTNTMYWNRVSDSGTPLMDTLFIYADTLMATLILKIGTANQYYSDSLGIGDYFWRVQTVDGATNESGFSELRRFTIQ